MSITFTSNQPAKASVDDIEKRLDNAGLLLAEIRGFLLIGQQENAARAALKLKRETGFALEAVHELEGAEAVRLVAGDMLDDYGIPEHILLDNGHEFAAKALTGGSPTHCRRSKMTNSKPKMDEETKNVLARVELDMEKVYRLVERLEREAFLSDEQIQAGDRDAMEISSDTLTEVSPKIKDIIVEARIALHVYREARK